MSTAFPELSRKQLGWGQHHAMHVSLTLQDEGASFASQHRLESTLILLYQFPVSSSPTQFTSSLWSRKEEEKLFTLFLSSLQSWLTVVSVSSVVFQWSARFWGAEVAAGQGINEMMSKDPSHCSPCAYQSRRQSSLFHSFEKFVLVRETGEGRKMKWKGGTREINGKR